MKLQQLSMDRILNVNWFSDIGRPIPQNSYLQAQNLKAAEMSLGSPEWENATLEESNKITGYLSVKEIIIFQEWNNLIKSAKVFFKNNILTLVPDLDGFDNILMKQCIEWDIVHYLVEDAYKDKLKSDLFFSELLSVYESGHIPCGWNGKWPSGQLIVF
ncbi:hypothetical protein ABW286_10345 [Erwinia papayae]|uniref:Uncharacterized protein n=1 Tax=Erwinia papayae TaxID=206499 RepID=A0ABV3N196_9GAMM